jgi:integrase
MRVNQIDFLDRTIRLEVGTTKNHHGRTVTMTQEAYALLHACAAGKKPDDHLFTRKDGSPVRDFRGAWRAVCVQSGLGKFICREYDQLNTKKKCKCWQPSREIRRTVGPRSSSHRRVQPAEAWSRRNSGDEDQRSQDRFCL